MKNLYLKKEMCIQLILVVVFFGFVGCDYFSNKSKKVEFLDNSFSVMMPATWSIRSDLNDVADLQIGNPVKEAYAIVISENKMDFDNLTIEGHSDLTRSFIKKDLENCVESNPEYLNNEFKTLRYQISGTIDGINVIYWHVTIETKEYFHQMLLWSLKSKFGKNTDDFNAVIKSFDVVNE